MGKWSLQELPFLRVYARMYVDCVGSRCVLMCMSYTAHTHTTVVSHTFISKVLLAQLCIQNVRKFPFRISFIHCFCNKCFFMQLTSKVVLSVASSCKAYFVACAKWNFAFVILNIRSLCLLKLCNCTILEENLSHEIYQEIVGIE